jgi:hypothetical protein
MANNKVSSMRFFAGRSPDQNQNCQSALTAFIRMVTEGSSTRRSSGGANSGRAGQRGEMFGEDTRGASADALVAKAVSMVRRALVFQRGGK